MRILRNKNYLNAIKAPITILALFFWTGSMSADHFEIDVLYKEILLGSPNILVAEMTVVNQDIDNPLEVKEGPFPFEAFKARVVFKEILYSGDYLNQSGVLPNESVLKGGAFDLYARAIRFDGKIVPLDQSPNVEELVVLRWQNNLNGFTVETGVTEEPRKKKLLELVAQRKRFEQRVRKSLEKKIIKTEPK